jgi:hypothetical protein
MVGVEALLLLYETSDGVWETFPLGTGGDVAFEYSERFSPFAITRLPNWSTRTFSADFRLYVSNASGKTHLPYARTALRRQVSAPSAGTNGGNRTAIDLLHTTHTEIHRRSVFYADGTCRMLSRSVFA